MKIQRIRGRARFKRSSSRRDLSGLGDLSLLDGIGALLTLTGDVPQVLVKTIAKGSEPDLTANVAGVSEIQEFTVQATGGTFNLYLGDPANVTDPLDYNASADEVEDALELLDGIGAGNVEVDRYGSRYRIKFVNGMAEKDVALLGVNDIGLTAEGPADRLVIDADDRIGRS